MIIRKLLILVIPIIGILLTASVSLPPEQAPWDGEESEISCDTILSPILSTLEGGQARAWQVTLDPGEYTVAAWASWDLVSLTLVVTDADGDRLATCTSPVNIPFSEIEISETTTINLNVYAGEAVVDGIPADLSVTVFSGQGCVDPEFSYTKAILNEWQGVLSEEGGELILWDVMALESEDSVYMEYELEPGTYSVVAETTNYSDDIDMYVRIDNEEISRNEEPDNFPVCHFSLESGATIEVEVDPWSYAEGSSTGLVIMVAEDED